MSKICVEYFDNSAEISAYEKTNSQLIEYLFKPSCDGYVKISGESYRVKDGVCIVNTSKFSNNEISPTLILGDRKITLPVMINRGEEFTVKDYDSDFLRNLSLRELRLKKRLDELERKVDGLSKKVYHTTIF